MRRDLRTEGLTRSRVLAAIVRLLDVGFFRIGREDCAREHETFGVASLRKEHVHIHNGVMVFDYPAKGSIERTLEVRNDPACRVVTSLLHRRSCGTNFFAYKEGRRWVDVHANDVNDYIKAVVGEPFSAKDFRTGDRGEVEDDTVAAYASQFIHSLLDHLNGASDQGPFERHGALGTR